jgi:hypothetical protein
LLKKTGDNREEVIAKGRRKGAEYANGDRATSN